jgi:very-short-patch-repair endonuclease
MEEYITTLRKKLIEHMTPAEHQFKRLLFQLGKGIYYRFNWPFKMDDGKLIFVDFWVTSHKCIFEIDGSSHLNKGEKDIKRDEYFAKKGIKTYRIENWKLMNQYTQTFEQVKNILKPYFFREISNKPHKRIPMGCQETRVISKHFL